MKRFVLTPRARQDVNDIWDYIADDSVESADRVLDALETAMVKLSKNPGIGHWREELTDKRHRFFSSIRTYRFPARAKTTSDHPHSPCSTRCPKHPRPWIRRTVAE